MPQLTPAQRALLRLVCWVAMADGDFAEEEQLLLQKLVARTLPVPVGTAADAVQTLAAEALQQPDLEGLVADLGDADERQLAVKLAFEMACINRRPDDASAINTAEKRAYRRLVELLDLPESEVAEAEWAGRQELEQRPSLLQLIGGALAGLGAWPALEDNGAVPPGYWL
ncbi:MAG: TerB family tellurite resistance protein [Prochlorococcaceae cyanobacterium]